MLLFGYLDIPLYVILFLSFIILMYIYGSHPKSVWAKLGVPSPPATAFVGHMHQLYDRNTGFRYNIRKWTKQYGKNFGLMFFRHPCLCVTDVDTLKEIFVKDFNNYVDRYMVVDAMWTSFMKKGLFFNGGTDWKRIRRILTPCFTSGKLKYLTHHINKTSRQLTTALGKHVQNGTQPNSKVVFSAYSLDALASSAFGIDLDSHNNLDGEFYQTSKEMANFKPSRKFILSTAGVFPVLDFLFHFFDIRYLPSKYINYFKDQFTKLVMERKNYPERFEEGDFLQQLMKAETDSTDEIHGSKKLTTEEVVAQCIIFVLAGYETTSASLQWLTYELAKNKDVQKRIRDEIEEVIGDEKEVTSNHCQKLKYMEAVINETLRMYPPIVLLTRIAEEARTLNGMNIPAGCGILIPVSNICRDPESFPDPDTFDPQRFLEENKTMKNLESILPFGFGPRQCIGMRLAMLQLKIALVHVLREMSIDDVLPRNPEVDDFSGTLLPREPLRLFLSPISS